MALTSRAPVARPRRATGRRPRTDWWALVMVAPATVGLAVLYLWPFGTTFTKSFQDVPAFGPGEFTGLDNYDRLLQDDAFWRAFGNSAVYTAIVVALGVPLAIVIASLIQQVSRGRAVYRVLFFLPVVTLPVAIGMVWRFILNGDFGIFNWVLSLVGIPGQFWVADDRFTIYVFAAVGIWMGIGTNIIILGAGLQGIPQDLYEAAEIDGAGRVRSFFSITLPMLSPTIFFVVVITLISALQMFDLVFVMLGSINNTAIDGSKTIVYLFYEAGFVQFRQGYAAAIAVVLLLMIILATAIQFRLQRRWVNYD